MTEDEIKALVASAVAEQLIPNKKEVTRIAKVEKAPLDIDGLFKIWKTSELEKTDILLIKSNNEFVKFDYESEFKELFDRLGFVPIIIAVRANDSFEIIQEEQLNAMGYFRQ